MTSISSPSHPLLDTMRWLTANTRFPASRLEPRAELLLFLGAFAAAQEIEEQQRFLIERRVGAQTSALKAHGLRRSQVHFKCDNSAKV